MPRNKKPEVGQKVVLKPFEDRRFAAYSWYPDEIECFIKEPYPRGERNVYRVSLLGDYDQTIHISDIKGYNAEGVRLAPQTQTILDHLQSVGNLSGVEAGSMYKVRSLPKRISEIKKAGYKLTKKFKRDNSGQRYVRYSYNPLDNKHMEIA